MTRVKVNPVYTAVTVTWLPVYVSGTPPSRCQPDAYRYTRVLVRMAALAREDPKEKPWESMVAVKFAYILSFSEKKKKKEHNTTIIYTRDTIFCLSSLILYFVLNVGIHQNTTVSRSKRIFGRGILLAIGYSLSHE